MFDRLLADDVLAFVALVTAWGGLLVVGGAIVEGVRHLRQLAALATFYMATRHQARPDAEDKVDR